jgi:hypothetical protein
MAVQVPSVSATARCVAAATAAAITVGLLAAIAVGFAGETQAPQSRTASLRPGGCTTHRNDAKHASASPRHSQSKGDQQCHAS